MAPRAPLVRLTQFLYSSPARPIGGWRVEARWVTGGAPPFPPSRAGRDALLVVPLAHGCMPHAAHVSTLPSAHVLPATLYWPREARDNFFGLDLPPGSDRRWMSGCGFEVAGCICGLRAVPMPGFQGDGSSGGERALDVGRPGSASAGDHCRLSQLNRVQLPARLMV